MTDQLPPPPPSVTPAGWYPDARSPGVHRWWDGTAWTDLVQAVQDAPPSLTPPPAIPPASVPYQLPGATAGGLDRDPGRPPRNGFATWSLILGVFGLLVFLIPFIGLALAATSLALGIVGIRAAQRLDAGRGVAIAGTIVGGVGTLIGVLVMVAFFGVVLNAEQSSSARESSIAASVAPSPTSEPVETDEVEASADGDPRFIELSGNDLDDIDKDLDDMIVTLDEDGTWRLLSNSVELSFNYGQLDARTPPASIASAWSEQLPILDGIFTDMSDAIADEQYDELREHIASAQSQVEKLRGVLDEGAEQ